MTRRLTDARLSFSQAQGYEDIPGPLKLAELPTEARTRIWNLFFVHLQQTKSTDNLCGGSWIGRDWEHILRAVHTDLHVSPLDEWSADFEPACKKLRTYVEEQPFNRIFDLIQFVLRHPKCPSEFVHQMQNTFAECRLAYTIHTTAPATILPAVTPEEGNALVESLQALRDAAMDGSAAHLRKASECINAGAWADSVRESIHAVESVARQLDSDAAKTLGPALSALEECGTLHPALKEAFSKLYGYTSDEQGVRHALLDRADAQVDQDEDVFMLGVGACASFASYLRRKHAAGASS